MVTFTLNKELDELTKSEVKQIIPIENKNEKIIFHPFRYHYAIITPRKIAIASLLLEEILFSADYEKQNLKIEAVSMN